MSFPLEACLNSPGTTCKSHLWQCRPGFRLQKLCQVLKKDEVYDWKDFCRYRAPIWYQAQVARILQTCNSAGLDIHTYKDCTETEWDEDRVWWHVQNALKIGTPEHINVEYIPGHRIRITRLTASNIPAVALTDTDAACLPDRIQPTRGVKRKAVETYVSRVVSLKKRRIRTKTVKVPVPGDPYGDYRITEEEFRKSLKDIYVHIEGKSCPINDMTPHHATEWFRSRVMAAVVDRINATWDAMASRDVRNLARQQTCVLNGRATELKWEERHNIPNCKRASTSLGPYSAPFADMLQSPSLGNWPLKEIEETKARGTKAKSKEELPLEKVLKGNTVEIAGLKFMVDLCKTEDCGGYARTMANPRIWML